MLERDGWRHVRTSGSHRQYQHPSKPGTITIAGNIGMDMPLGTFRSILKRAQLK